MSSSCLGSIHRSPPCLDSKRTIHLTYSKTCVILELILKDNAHSNKSKRGTFEIRNPCQGKLLQRHGGPRKAASHVTCLAEISEEIYTFSLFSFMIYSIQPQTIFAIDHRMWRTGLPVRSAVLKPHAGWLVVGWVTTSESQLLIVFYILSILCFGGLSRRCQPVLFVSVFFGLTLGWVVGRYACRYVIDRRGICCKDTLFSFRLLSEVCIIYNSSFPPRPPPCCG